jgi:hypothetical protein
LLGQTLIGKGQRKPLKVAEDTPRLGQHNSLKNKSKGPLNNAEE